MEGRDRSDGSRRRPPVTCRSVLDTSGGKGAAKREVTKDDRQSDSQLCRRERPSQRQVGQPPVGCVVGPRVVGVFHRRLMNALLFLQEADVRRADEEEMAPRNDPAGFDDERDGRRWHLPDCSESWLDLKCVCKDQGHVRYVLGVSGHGWQPVVMEFVPDAPDGVARPIVRPKDDASGHG